MKFSTFAVNALCYGAFAVWLAAIWHEPLRQQLFYTGGLMFGLGFLIAAADFVNDDAGKNKR